MNADKRGANQGEELDAAAMKPGQPIPACLTTCGLIGGEVPLGGYYPPLGDEKNGEDSVRVAGNSLAVVMQSHGVFTLGANPAQAVCVAIEVEEIAKITRLAMLGGEPILLTGAQVAVMVGNYRENLASIDGLPASMQAAVYLEPGRLELRQVSVPRPGPSGGRSSAESVI